MKKQVLLVAMVAVAAVSVWSWRHSSAPAVSANRLLADRIWIDHVPRNETDTINVFAALTEHSVGVFQATSQWRGNFELFRYEASGPELRLVYPQTGDREAVRAKARKCTEHKMDFCLEIEGASRGVKKYYSREGWEIGQNADLDQVKQRVEALRTQIEASE
jgi:hypothetical protein